MGRFFCGVAEHYYCTTVLWYIHGYGIDLWSRPGSVVRTCAPGGAFGKGGSDIRCEDEDYNNTIERFLDERPGRRSHRYIDAAYRVV